MYIWFLLLFLHYQLRHVHQQQNKETEMDKIWTFVESKYFYVHVTNGRNRHVKGSRSKWQSNWFDWSDTFQSVSKRK